MKREIKLSQFADDTTLFNADLASLERALKIIDDFGRIAGLSLNVKKKQRLFERNDLEIHETRNMSDRNRRFGASCTIIKVT